MAETVQIGGFQANYNTFAQVDSTHDALRISIRPHETIPDPQGVVGGHYFLNASTGLMAAGIASAAQVFTVLWRTDNKLFVLKRFKVQVTTQTAFAANSIGCPLQLFVGHGSTALGSGGTSIAYTGGKGRSTFANSSFTNSGELRIASTAAITAPTGQVLEAVAVGGCQGAPPTTNTQSTEMYMFDQRDFGEHPIILTSGDSLAVTTLNPSASGTWTATFSLSWLEVAAF